MCRSVVTTFSIAQSHRLTKKRAGSKSAALVGNWRVSAPARYRAKAMRRLHALFASSALFGLVACSQSHSAVVRTAALPPPPDPAVRHAAPLWVDLGPGVRATQCVTPKLQRELC